MCTERYGAALVVEDVNEAKNRTTPTRESTSVRNQEASRRLPRNARGRCLSPARGSKTDTPGETSQCAPKPEFGDEFHIPDEVKERVPEAGCGKGGKHGSQAG